MAGLPPGSQLTAEPAYWGAAGSPRPPAHPPQAGSAARCWASSGSRPCRWLRSGTAGNPPANAGSHRAHRVLVSEPRVTFPVQPACRQRFPKIKCPVSVAQGSAVSVSEGRAPTGALGS